VIIVASVSCIYGIGSPKNYQAQVLKFNLGENYNRSRILENLTTLQYERNDYDLKRGNFRVKGETIEIYPAYTDFTYKISFNADEVESIEAVDNISGISKEKLKSLEVYPAKHFITPDIDIDSVILEIESDLAEQIKKFKLDNKLIEAQRIEERVKYDIEMIRETGYCSGIENYSRYFDHRKQGEPPSTLIDFFPKDFLLVVDESHMTIPQIRGMFAGDRSRKETLVNFGFRLPSAIDNRPLKYDEFEQKINQTIFCSATPDNFETELSKENIVEQLIRPTGIVDPKIEIRATKNQINDLIFEIKKNITNNQRTIITTLTKRMAEDLTEFLQEREILVAYLHSDVATLEGTEILRKLRLGKFDVLVGINLLREGIDLPEVSMIAILDADKEGFLRGKTALIQTTGRAARHINGRVIMYADKVTQSMKTAIDETNRRREKQIDYNRKNNIAPKMINKKIAEDQAEKEPEINFVKIPKTEKTRLLKQLKIEMEDAAIALKFEKAAKLRDEIIALEQD
jgi:excinuclease ABC subunit B